MRPRCLRRAALGLVLTLAAGCEPGDGTECGAGTAEIDGVCFAFDGGAPAPDGGPDGCPDGTTVVDLDDDGVPEACLPAPVAGDCDDPPLLEGPILRDTVLAPGACFRVEGELAVTGGALLALSAGVDIDFGPDAAVVVDGGYLASLGTADAPVRLHGGDAPGHWRGVHFAAASAVALEPPAPEQTFSVALPDDTQFAPVLFEQAQSVTAFYDYRNASAHTGFEAVDRALVALHRDTGTGSVGLVFINGAPDAAQPRFAVEYHLEGVPAGARLAVLDDPDSVVTRAGDQLTIRQGARRNTDGFALDRLPNDADWSLTVTMTQNAGSPAENDGDGDGLTEWVFMAPDGTVTPLLLGESFTIEATTAERPQPVPGDRSSFNRLAGVQIEHAQAGLLLDANDVAVRLDAAALRNNQVGIDARAAGARLRVADSVLAENIDAAAHITAWQLDGFVPGNRFEGERSNVVVRGGTLSADRVVPGDVPTVFTDVLRVSGGATLFAIDSVEMVFSEKATLLLDGGRLVARGGGDGTLLRGAARTPGFWTGLRVINGGAIELAEVRLTDAGGDAGDGVAAAIRVLGAGEGTLIDSQVEDHDGLSIDVINPAVRLSTRDTVLSGGARITGAQLGGLGAGTRSGAPVRVSAGRWAREGQLTAGVDYQIDGRVEIGDGGHLSTEPGAQVFFEADSGLAVSDGAVAFIGTVESPVLLRGDAWRGVAFFEAGGQRSTFDHVRFDGAGAASWRDDRRGAISVLGDGVRLKLCNVDYGDAPRAIDLAFDADIIDCEDADPCEDGGPVELCGVDPLPVSCGAGTEEVVAEDGGLECRPDATACEDGEAFDPDLRQCRVVEGGDVRCGAGTEQIDGECRPIDDGPNVTCGAGTEEVIDADGLVSCRPDATACEDGEAYDEALRRCRAVGPVELSCGAGTEEIDGECRPIADGLVCGDGTVRVGDACQPSVCGDGIVDAGNDEECDGGDDCNRFCRSVADAECLDDDDCGDGAICDLGQLACVGGGAVFGPCEGPAVDFTPLVHPIAAETTLVAGNCYFVPDDTVVQDATLNIQAGVQLRFAADAALVFQGASVLNAEGTDEAPIVFDGVEPRPGYWQGVAFNVAGELLAGSVLRHVHLLNAGGQTFQAFNQRYDRLVLPHPTAALLVTGPRPALELSGLRVAGSPSIGVSLLPTDDEAPDVDVVNATFADNAVDAVLPAQEVDVLRAPFAFSAEVHVRGSIAQSTTFRRGVPYRFIEQAHATDAAIVTVEAGAVLRFGPAMSLSFDDASLIADAADADPILLDSTTPDTDWIGVALMGGQRHRLRNLIIRRAGGASFDQFNQRFPRTPSALAASLLISAPTVHATLADLQLLDGAGYGLHVLDHRADLGEGLRRLTVRNNALGGAVVEPSGMGALLADGDWGADQTAFVFGYTDGRQSVLRDQTVHANVPFLMQRSIAVTGGAHLRFAPGARMVFSPGAGIVVDGGSLEVRGRPDAPIAFESENEDPWRGISFFQNTLSDRNVLRHVRLAGAGAGFEVFNSGVPRVVGSQAAISVASDTARVELGELTITNYPVYGIRADDPGAQVGGTLGRSRFESAVGTAAMRLHANHASMVGPYVHFDPAPQIDNPQAPAAWVDIFGETTRDTHLGPNVFWRVTEHLHVTTGATLSVFAGARVTFNETKGVLMDGGFLRVLGTEESPVTFTSRFDDPPFEDPGRWRGIGFRRDSDGDRNLLRHLVIEHAGDSAWSAFNQTTPSIPAARPSAIDLIGDTTRLRMHDVTLREGSGLGIHSEAAFRVDDCSDVRIEYPEDRQVESVLNDVPVTLRDLCRWAGPFPSDTIEEAREVFMSPVPLRGTLGAAPDDRWFRLDPPGVGGLLIDTETGRFDQRVSVVRVVQFESVEQAEVDPAAGRVIYEPNQNEGLPPPGTASGPGRQVYRVPVQFGEAAGAIDQNGGPVYVRLDERGAGYVDYRVTFDRAPALECQADLECGFEERCVGGACIDAVAEGFDESNDGAGEPMRSLEVEGSVLRTTVRGALSFITTPTTTVGPVDVDPVDRYQVQVHPTRRHLSVSVFATDETLELVLRSADGARIDPSATTATFDADVFAFEDARRASWLNLAPGRYTLEVGATDFEQPTGYLLFADHDSRPWVNCVDDPQACFNACGSNFNQLVIESLDATGELPGADICTVDLNGGDGERAYATFGPGEVCVNARREPLCESVTDDADAVLDLDAGCDSVLPLGRGGRLSLPNNRFLYRGDNRPPTVSITSANERTAVGDGYDLAACNADETCCVRVGRHVPEEDADAPDTVEWAIPANPNIIDADGPDIE